MPSIASPALDSYDLIRNQAMQTLFDNLENLCEGTLVVDQDARIVWISKRYAARFGITSTEECIGKSVESVIPGSLMRQVVTTGQPIWLDILENKKESFIVTRMPLTDSAGRVIGAFAYALYDHLQPLSPIFSKYMKLQQELASTRSSLEQVRRTRYNFSNFIGTSQASVEVKRQARRAAHLDATVLLQGESGTGKEVLAQSIHNASSRSHKPFISVNVAAIPETLMEAEFFGVAPGAYTGADKRTKDGKFQLANGGTLFLDEIGEMPLHLQSKLLRVLQEQEFEPLGSNHMIKADARIIAATSVDLVKLINEGRFRADLYYRINVLSIAVPPLRERFADLELLCEAILEDIAVRSGELQRDLAPDVLALFRACEWRGNVRELRNVIEKVVMMTERTYLVAADFMNAITPNRQLEAMAPKPAEADGDVIPYAIAMAQFERETIGAALAATNGNIPKAAQRLGMGRATLYKKIAALKI
jgi:transcriptional regulator with PAS, ATPase and Fis domain